MAKFTRFDSRNKKKGKHKSYSREEKDFRIKHVDTKRRIKIGIQDVKDYEQYTDSSEKI
jgi:hypothetical protein